MSKDNKTSKTARVMNLLSKKPDPAAPAPQGEEAAAPVPAAPAAPAVPPHVAALGPGPPRARHIPRAPGDALESELGPAPAAPQPEPVPEPEPQPVQQQPEPEPEPQPVQQQPAPAPEPAPQPEPEPEPVPEEEPQPVEEPHFKEPLVPENPGYINVMQVLVEEKAPKYVEMFGLCTCKRCMEDVKAFTLNHLPPKYVVLEPNDRVPRLTVYEGKFSSDITAQLLQACKVVMETPHHTRG